MHLLIEANRMRDQKEYRTALHLYRKALDLDEENADLLAIIANSYSALAFSNSYDSGQAHEEAVTWMEKAILRQPNDARLHAMLAQYCELGLLNYERAVQEYRTAIALNPNDAWILSSAAALYGVPEEVVTRDEVIAWLERATQLDPHNPNYLFRLGTLYYEADRWNDAERVWMKALLCPRPLDVGPTQMIESLLNIK
jgi:adenylate cyclase